jgi:tRNA 2-thiouridine synthesizing protein E
MEFQYGGKTYETDISGFLVAPDQWDDNFAEGMALKLGMSEGLTEEHWKVIRFLRTAAKETGRCRLVYQTCRQNNLRLADLGRLFPTGYLRRACKLAVTCPLFLVHS